MRNTLYFDHSLQNPDLPRGCYLSVGFWCHFVRILPFFFNLIIFYLVGGLVGFYSHEFLLTQFVFFI